MTPSSSFGAHALDMQSGPWVWIAKRVILISILSALVSGGTCYLIYWIVGWENYGSPIPLLMPILAPLLLSPFPAVIILRYTAIISKQRADLAELSFTLSQARDEAVAATEAKSAYLTMISHEIRTPLGGMKSIAELLQRDLPADKTKEMLTMLLGTSDALLDLLNSILDNARLAAGRVELNEREFDLFGLLDQVARLWQHALERKGVQFVVDLPKENCRVIADDFRCQQILNNFLSNAAKFTDTGTVTLGGKIDQVSPGMLKLSLYVRDTGPGMTAEQIPLLFKDFEQTSKAVAGQHGGSGLGLSISGKLARLMDGQISVKSTPGEGSCFTLAIEVPVAVQATG